MEILVFWQTVTWCVNAWLCNDAIHFHSNTYNVISIIVQNAMDKTLSFSIVSDLFCVSIDYSRQSRALLSDLLIINQSTISMYKSVFNLFSVDCFFLHFFFSFDFVCCFSLSSWSVFVCVLVLHQLFSLFFLNEMPTFLWSLNPSQEASTHFAFIFCGFILVAYIYIYIAEIWTMK